MGVLGLWQILESVGHPIKIDGLEGKRLGVDANIWLYKFIRGFRDKDNASSIDSHKLGLFNRVCKLLFYKIKPVFVFDGPAPVLKRRTLERRQDVRNKNFSKMQTAAAKLLAEHLREQYPEADVKEVAIRMPEFRSNNLAAAEKLTDEDRNLFYLPPPMKQEQDISSDEEIELEGDGVDVHSEDFKQLPPEIRYEILKDKKQNKLHRRAELMPENASDFSNLQLQKLKARRAIQEKIEECEREICGSYTGEMNFRVQSDPTKFMIYTKQQKEIPEPKPEPVSVSERPGPSTSLGKLTDEDKNVSHSPTPKDHEHDGSSDKQLKPKRDKVNACPENSEKLPSEVRNEILKDNKQEPGRVPESEQSPKPVPELVTLSEPELSPVPELSTWLESEPSSGSEPELLPVPELSTWLESSPSPASDIQPVQESSTWLESSPSRATDPELEILSELVREPEPERELVQDIVQEPEPEKVQEPIQEIASKPVREPVREPIPELVVESERPVLSASQETTRILPPRETNKVTSKIVEEAKELLRLFGIPYIDATGEAEAQCALLESLNLTEGTITDDSDIWLFGAKHVYRYFFSDDKWVMQYKMPDIEFHLRMNRENLVCFAMLVGSDYTDGIMNVGPVTALEILSEFQGEELGPLLKYKEFVDEYRAQPKGDKRINGTDIRKRKRLLKFELPDEFPSQTVFDGYLRPVADTSNEEFSWGLPDLDQLREYARRNFGWDPKRIDEKLLPVMKKLSEKKTQPTIDSYFFKTAASQNPELFRSKRVNDALKKISTKDSTTATATTTTTDKKKEKTRAAPKGKAKAKPKAKGRGKGKATTKRGDKNSNQPVPEVVCLSETDDDEMELEC